MDAKNDWAPDRIFLQKDQAGPGDHTWCENSVGDDEIEEVAYVRADVAAPVALAAAAPLTDEQIAAIWLSTTGFNECDMAQDVIGFARALLSFHPTEQAGK